MILVTFNSTTTIQSLSWVMAWNLLKRSMIKMGKKSNHANCCEIQTCSGTEVQWSHGHLLMLHQCIVPYYVYALYLYTYWTSVVCSFKLSCSFPLFQKWLSHSPTSETRRTFSLRSWGLKPKSLPWRMTMRREPQHPKGNLNMGLMERI